MAEYTFCLNPIPKVRMTSASKWSDRARVCLDFQNMVRYKCMKYRLPKFGKAKVGFAKLHFYRKGRDADIDNLQKSFFDGLQYYGVFENDNQIRALDNVRVYSVKDEKSARIKFIIYDYDELQKQDDNNTPGQ